MASTTKKLSEATVNNASLDNDTRFYTTKNPNAPNPIGGYTTYQQLYAAIEATGGFMFKADYDANDNGVVDSSEKVEGVDAAQPKQYYGKNSAGDVGFHFLPAVEDATGNIKNVIYVGKNGADAPGYGSINSPFLTLKYALSTITDNGTFNRYLILVGPGIYVEDNPVQCKAWVDIAPMGGGLSSVFEGQNPNNVLFQLADRVSINGFVVGRNSQRAVCMEVPGLVSLKDMVFADTTAGICVDSTGAIVYATNILGFSFAEPLENLIRIRSGNFEGVNIGVVNAANVTNVVNAAGRNTTARVAAISTDSDFVETCAFADDRARLDVVGSNISNSDVAIHSCGGATVNVIGGIIENCGISLYLPTGSSYLGVHGSTVLSSKSFDLRADSPNGKFRSSGCLLNQNKVLLNPAGDYLFTGVSEAEGDEALFAVGEFHVGIPERPSEAVFGEGDSYTRGMLAYSWDGTTFTNITDIWSSFTGSSIGFADTTAGAALYIASDLQSSGDYVKHYGVKVIVEQELIVGSGDVAIEIWDGTGWTSFTTMMTSADSPYLPFANQAFTQTGTFQIRANAFIDDVWVKNDPIGSGTDRFWVRAIIKSPITQTMLLEQVKLHTSRSELNQDGWLEYFGRARPIGKLPLDAGLLENANAAPGNQDVFVSDNVAVGRQGNNFVNAATDRVGLNTNLPFDCDTGSPIKLEWSVATTIADSLDIDWVIRWAWTTDGDGVYFGTGNAPTTGPNEQSISLSLAPPTAVEQQKTYEVWLNIEEMVARRDGSPGDTLWLSIERTVGDAHAGNVALININATYVKWCEGGHLP